MMILKKHFLQIVWIISILFCVQAGSVQAATYYVSATSGNDSNNGLSQDTPWQNHPWMSHATAQAGACTLQPGDKVLLKRGDVWNDYISLGGSGDDGNLIITGAYGSGNLPRIICPTKKVTTGWTQVSRHIYRIRITHAGDDVGWVWQQGVSLDSALQMRSDTNLSEGEFFFNYIDNTKGDLYVYKKGGGSPNGTEIYYCSKHFVIGDFLPTAASFIRFENMELWGGNRGTIYVEGKWSGSRSNIELDHLIVRFSGCSESSMDPRRTSFGIHFVRYSNCSITNCMILNTACFGIQFYDVHDTVIANNEVGYHSAGNGIWTAGIKIVGGDQNQDPLNIVIENNYIYKGLRAKAVGIWNDVNAHNVTVRYNKIYEAATGIFIENGTARNKAYYNSVGKCTSGIKCGATINDGVYDNEIYNNLIADANFSFVFLHDANGSHTVKNNISLNPIKGHVKWNKDYFINGSLNIDNNCYFPEMENDFHIVRGREPNITTAKTKTIYEWQLLSYDSHSIVNDPKFASLPSGDYNLLENSPCIDKGVNVGLNRDIEGSSVPRGCCPDIGLFENGVLLDPGLDTPKNLRIINNP
jgi:parallel beta-helix repeat protein